MKNKILLPLLFIAGIIGSCDKNTPPVKTSEITFNISTPQLPTRQTKSVNLARYIMTIYKADDPNTVVEKIEQSSGTFILSLENNTSYICLFWADETAPDDNVNGTYNASDLKNVTLNEGKEMAEAFFARLDVLNDETVFNVTLKRPIAQVNIVETSNVATSANVVITHDHHNGFNTFSSDVIGDPESKSITITPSVTTGTLGSYLTFAPVVGMMKDFTAVYNTAVSNSIPNVPLTANSITNIRGSYTSGNEDFIFIIMIDDVWEEAISGVHINTGTTGAPKWLMVADRNADKNGPNGAATSSSSTDYGYYYQWGNASSDHLNIDKAYSACYNLGEGSGTWRLPTGEEWEVIVGNGTNNPKVQLESNDWKLYDERVGHETSYVYFPLAGYIDASSYGSTNIVSESGLTGVGYYWSTDELTTYPIFGYLGAFGGPTTTSSIHAYDKNAGLSVRCVQDIQN